MLIWAQRRRSTVVKRKFPGSFSHHGNGSLRESAATAQWLSPCSQNYSPILRMWQSVSLGSTQKSLPRKMIGGHLGDITVSLRRYSIGVRVRMWRHSSHSLTSWNMSAPESREQEL